MGQLSGVSLTSLNVFFVKLKKVRGLNSISSTLTPILKLFSCPNVPAMWRFLRCKRWKEWKKWLQRKNKKTLLQKALTFALQCKVFVAAKEFCYFRSSLSFLAVNALTMRKNSWLSSFVFICTTKPHLFISSPSLKYQNKWNEIPKTKSELWFRDEDCPLH